MLAHLKASPLSLPNAINTPEKYDLLKSVLNTPFSKNKSPEISQNFVMDIVSKSIRAANITDIEGLSLELAQVDDNDFNLEIDKLKNITLSGKPTDYCVCEDWANEYLLNYARLMNQIENINYERLIDFCSDSARQFIRSFPDLTEPQENMLNNITHESFESGAIKIIIAKSLYSEEDKALIYGLLLEDKTSKESFKIERCNDKGHIKFKQVAIDPLEIEIQASNHSIASKSMFGSYEKCDITSKVLATSFIEKDDNRKLHERLLSNTLRDLSKNGFAPSVSALKEIGIRPDVGIVWHLLASAGADNKIFNKGVDYLLQCSNTQDLGSRISAMERFDSMRNDEDQIEQYGNKDSILEQLIINLVDRGEDILGAIHSSELFPLTNVSRIEQVISKIFSDVLDAAIVEFPADASNQITEELSDGPHQSIMSL
jgi:hypothetical protein